VLAFLDPEIIDLYAGADAWQQMQSEVVQKLLEAQ
jgi:hypothetical protein